MLILARETSWESYMRCVEGALALYQTLGESSPVPAATSAPGSIPPSNVVLSSLPPHTTRPTLLDTIPGPVGITLGPDPAPLA